MGHIVAYYVDRKIKSVYYRWVWYGLLVKILSPQAVQGPHICTLWCHISPVFTRRPGPLLGDSGSRLFNHLLNLEKTNEGSRNHFELTSLTANSCRWFFNSELTHHNFLFSGKPVHSVHNPIYTKQWPYSGTCPERHGSCVTPQAQVLLVPF